MNTKKAIDEYIDIVQEGYGHLHNFKFDWWLMKTGITIMAICGSALVIMKILAFFNLIKL